MLQLKHLTLFCGLLAAVISFQDHVQADVQNRAPSLGGGKTTTTCEPDLDEDKPGDNFGENPGDDDNNGDRDNETLCNSFQALRATIEKDTLVDLIQSHYQCNSKFRKALCYYNTTRFQLVAQELQQSEVFNTMLEELRNAGVDTTDIENIVDIFACLLVPAPQPDKSCDCKALRGHTFVGDLLAAMPQQAVHDYTTSARKNQTNYARFVDTVSSSGFQSRMRANMMKRDVTRPLRTLRRNGWDMPELLRAVTSILSW
ncbi:uncharacterized protein LOC115760945 [Drosophila novamexicana]|uniref:uncharacterized protein LOC115760945 n=1 Tax=Drosophila novamexicana TaxID=47314 RepID=UPI0011E59560|nr:uncharacterized protein LOC115760945 [Drosophila novamexicana]